MNLSADTILNVIFGLYGGLFTVLWIIMKSQVKLVKEQTTQKDATIEYLKQVNKKLQEDTDPVKWKARLELNRETAEEEIKQLKQLNDSESKKKVLALKEVSKLSTKLLSTEQQLTKLQNQYNASIVISGSANLEALGAPTVMVDYAKSAARRLELDKKTLMAKFGLFPKKT